MHLYSEVFFFLSKLFSYFLFIIIKPPEERLARNSFLTMSALGPKEPKGAGSPRPGGERGRGCADRAG